MATNSSAQGKRSGTGRSSGSGFKKAASAMSAETILDLVERLGLVDVVLGKVKSRIEETALDDLVDEIGRYMRRNPEVIVFVLGAATLVAGAIVFVGREIAEDNDDDWDEDEVEEETVHVTAAPGRVRASGDRDRTRRAV